MATQDRTKAPTTRAEKRAEKRAAKKAEKKPGRIKADPAELQMTKKTDPRIGLILLGIFVLGALASASAVMLPDLPHAWSSRSSSGCMVGLLAALIVFGRRAQAAGISQIEGKPGAAAAALGMLKRGWKTDPAIGFTKQQDVVTRVVGPPGIVLIGEGNPNRLRPLMSSERRSHERVACEVPIHEIVVGHDDGQVPLAKLARHVRKLGKDLKPAADDRRPPAAQGARRQPLQRADAQGPGADLDEGHARRSSAAAEAQRRYAADPVHEVVQPAPVPDWKISGGIDDADQHRAGQRASRLSDPPVGTSHADPGEQLAERAAPPAWSAGSPRGRRSRAPTTPTAGPRRSDPHRRDRRRPASRPPSRSTRAPIRRGHEANSAAGAETLGGTDADTSRP